ncbi:MAG: hypothetical protein JWN55_2011 [Frankiales bacterium]|jgi:hypothetical protein|nr:hypothetical protein [Frankiales bacterium]
MKRTRIAGVMSASTAVALVTGAAPAQAHDPAAAPDKAGPAVTERALLAPLVAGRLDELQAKVGALQARVEVVPDRTVLRAGQRDAAVAQLRFATRLTRTLGSVEGLTPAQAEQLAAIQAQLGVVAGELRALLANRPAPRAADPVKVGAADRPVRTTDTRPAARHDARHDGRWDGHWGKDGRSDRHGDRRSDRHGDRHDDRHGEHHRHHR